jgi:PIN domain nuclease of toxin-antitoxin system
MLDASALLAYLLCEPGGEKVPAVEGKAAISAVNLAEAISVLTLRGVPARVIRTQLSRTTIDVIDFDSESAEAAGLLVRKTRQHGLSLGDRACLVEASRAGIPVLTADRAWKTVDVGVSIQIIR